MTSSSSEPDALSDEQQLINGAKGLGIDLSVSQTRQMLAYLQAVLEENRSINVTAIRDYRTAITQHLLDSLTLVKLWKTLSPAVAPEAILDLGTGGGFPAIPLAIAWQASQVTAIDGTGKKIAVVKRCLEQTSITNVEAVQARGLDLPRQYPRRRGSYDMAVARAVGAADVLLKELAPLMKSGGRIFLMKGPTPPDAEILAARKVMIGLRLKNYELLRAQLPGVDDRAVLTYEKI